MYVYIYIYIYIYDISAMFLVTQRGIRQPERCTLCSLSLGLFGKLGAHWAQVVVVHCGLRPSKCHHPDGTRTELFSPLSPLLEYPGMQEVETMPQDFGGGQAKQFLAAGLVILIKDLPARGVFQETLVTVYARNSARGTHTELLVGL